MKQHMKREGGFSLIEVMVVLAVMGLVMGAVYGFYLSQVRSSQGQERIVETQQSLRVAMDMITRDIKKAGFLVPIGANPVLGTSTDTSIGVNTASATGICAVVNALTTIPAGTSEFDVPVDSASAVDTFKAGDDVRIIRPENKALVVSTRFRVAVASGTTLRLVYQSGDAPSGSQTTKLGDVIARTSSSDPAVTNTITYSLLDGNASTTDSCPANEYCVQRVDTGGAAQVVAASIANNGLQFRYYLDGSIIPVQAASVSDWAKVRAVEVTITGNANVWTEASWATGRVARERELTFVVTLKNRVF